MPEASAPSIRTIRIASRVVTASPDLVGAAVAGFSVGPMVLLLAGHLSAGLGVPLGILGAAIACWLSGLPAVQRPRPELRWTLVALLFVICWFAFNVHYTAQDVYNTRDPATYTITGEWLVHHGSLQIQTHPEIFGTPPGNSVASGSYALINGNVLNAQGDHLLSVFLGLSGAMFGTTALLATNCVITALALFVFFGVARRIVGPVFGLMALAALGLSMPIIYVGRDAYTEPLTMLFLMSALTFVHRGCTRRRPADWAVAGLAAGAATCVRVDSYGALIGLVAAATVFVAAARAGERAAPVRCVAALAAGGVLPLALGWLDLTHLSRQYFDSQHANITHLIGALVLVIVVAPVVIWLLWSTRLRGWISAPRTGLRITHVAVWTLVLVFGALAVRPAWQMTHGAFRTDLVNMQVTWGAKVCGTCTYNEQTVHWLADYYGWPTVLLGVAGYAVLITALVRRRCLALAGVIAMGLSMSALYLWSSEVAPDQPWAMRRYVPVILPLMLVAAGAALRAAWRRPGLSAVLVRPLVAAGVGYVVLFSLAVSWPMRHVREEVPQLKQLQAICAAVGPHGAVLESDDDIAFGYGQSIRSFCNVPTIALIDPSIGQLQGAQASVAANGRTLYALTGRATSLPFANPQVQPFSVVRVSRWPNQINKAPDFSDFERGFQTYTVFLARVDANGVPHPVAP